MTVAEDAKVFEAVHPDRLNYRWIARRKFRAGQSYGYHSLRENTPTARMQLFVVAAMKVVFCTVMAALLSLSEGRRNFWTLRANMHAGVIAAIFGKQEEELYSHT